MECATISREKGSGRLSICLVQNISGKLPNWSQFASEEYKLILGTGMREKSAFYRVHLSINCGITKVLEKTGDSLSKQTWVVS